MERWRTPGPGTVPCRGTRNVEADSVAYLIAAWLRIQDCTYHIPAHPQLGRTGPHARRAATVQAVASRVLGAAARITAHLDAALPEAGRGTHAVHAPGINEAGPAGHAHVRASTADDAVSSPAPLPGDELARVQQAAVRFFRGRLAGSWVPGYLAGR